VAGVYTYRFIFTSNSGQWVYWTVPAGYRAVLRSLSLVNTDASTRRCIVSVAGKYIYFSDVQAAGTTRSVDLRMAVYQGEQMGAYTESAAMPVQLTGYLFRDDGSGYALEEAVVGDPPPQFEAP
jgi:hypothetical protein